MSMTWKSLFKSLYTKALTKAGRRRQRLHELKEAARRAKVTLFCPKFELLEDRVVPANFTAGDLAVLQLATNSTNTTGTILGLNPTNGTVDITYPVSSTGSSALRFSDSGTSGFLTDSNDGTQLVIGAYNTTDSTTTDLATTGTSLTTGTDPDDHAVATIDNSTNLTIQAHYVEPISGDQTRSATTADGSNWDITDKGGYFTDTTGGTTGTNISAVNYLVTRSFGGTLYVASTKASAGVSTVSGTTVAGLPGVPADADIQDFYLIQSGHDGSTYDVMYTIDQGGGNNITKYSLVSGSWVSNGTFAATASDTSMIAENNGAGGANLYVVTTSQSLGNSVMEFTDSAGWNTAMNISNTSGTTLYTTSATTTLKGIAFAPISSGSSAPTITSANNTSVYYQNPASTFTVTATGSPTPTYSLSGAPSWVTINSTTGLLSINTTSAPSETQTTNYNFTIIATNGVGTPASQSFTLSNIYGAPTIASADDTSVYAGLSGTFQVTAEAGPPVTGYSLSSAPNWVTINSSTGVITMTNAPAVSTTTAVGFTVDVTNSVGTTPQSFTVDELPTISYATQSSNYTQNFSSLPDAGGTASIVTGTDTGQVDLTGATPNGFGGSTNTALAGWYTYNLDSGAVEKFGQGEPSTTTGALFDFNDGTAGSQSLGTISTSSTASRYGAVFINTTGTTLNTFSLSYLGEEWWANSGAGSQLTFSYSLGAGIQTAINPSNPVGSLSFTAPVTGTGSYLDGSQSPNQVSVSGTVNNITWLPGEALTIEWDKGTTGSSDGLGVANVQFSASYQAQFAPTITNAPSAYTTVGNSSTYQLTANAIPTAAWTLSGYNGGTVPSWITVNSSTGVLSFTTPPALPTNGADAAYTFTVTANNGVGTPATQTFTVIETNPAAAFTPTDLLLYQTGNNNTSDPKYAAMAPVSFQEITTTGTPVENVPVPDNLTVGGTGNQPLSEDLGTTATANGSGDGLIELSLDGTEIGFTGNDDWLNATDFSTSNRVIGVLGNSPTSLNTTTYGDFSGGDDSRGAVIGEDGAIYEFGHTTNGGLRYFDGTGNSPATGTEVDTSTTKNNIRDAIVGFNGQIYYSSDKSSVPGIFISTTASGVPVFEPTAAGDVDDEVIENNGTGAGNNPNGMFLADTNGDGVLDTGDSMYFLDSGAGLYVSTYTSPTGTNPYGTWSTPTAVYGGDPTAPGAVNWVGLTGQVTPSGVQLYFTSADGTGNSAVYSLLDTGNPSQIATEIASTSSTNGGMQYEGVSFAPYASATSISLSINGQSSGSVAATTGSTVTFVATVPASLNGTTVYFDNAATQTEMGSATVVNGTATFSTSALNSGQYTVEAYTGGIAGSVAPAASSTINLSLTGSTPSGTTVSVNLNPTTVNEPTTIAATIAPSSGTGAYPTGTAYFYSNGQLLSSVSLSTGTQGSGSSVAVPFTTTGLPQGTDTIIAVYTGDNTYEASTSSNYSEAVNPGATISVATSNADPAWNSGSPPSVTLSASVTGNGLSGLPNGSPTGQIQFYILNEDGSTTNIGSPVNLSGSGNVYTATTTYTFTGPGSVQIEAEYIPNSTTAPYSQYASITTANNSVPGVIDTAVKAFAVGDLIALERPAQYSNASNPVYLIEFNTFGGIVQTIELPIASLGSTNIVGLSPHASTEGALATSGIGSMIGLEGFDLQIGTSGAASSPSATVPRTSASITDLGVIDTSTAVTEPSSDALTNVRGSVTYDGKEFWIAGDSSANNSGLQYTTDGGTTTVKIDPTNGTSYTDIQILDGVAGSSSSAATIYVAGGAGVIGTVTGSAGTTSFLPGTTLPTDSAGVSVTPLPGLAAAYAGQGFTSPAPYGFYMVNDTTGSSANPNVLYVGDQNYGLLKFYYNGTDWVFAGQRLNNSGSIEGLTGTWSSSGVTLYMTAAQGTGFPGNQIATITDSQPYNQPFMGGNLINDIYTLPLTNTSTFSGMVFAPLPEANVAISATSPTITYGDEQAFTLTATVSTTNSGTGTPTGTVDFFAGSTYLGSETLNAGVARLTLTASELPVGAYQFTARYDGDSNNGGGFSPDFSGGVDYTPGDVVIDEVATGTVVGGTISGITESGTTATVTTTSATGLAAGDSVTISGAAVSGYNGNFTVGTVSGSTFTIAATAGLGTAGAGGTVFWNYASIGGATSLEDLNPSTSSLNSANTVNLTSTGSSAFTEAGTATTEGYLTDASDGQSVELAGYNVAAGSTTAGTSSTSGPNALVGVLAPDGTINDSTVIPYADTQETTTGTTPKSANSVKAVASADGLGFYVATDDYIQYVPFGNTASTATTTVEEEFTGNDGTSGQFASSQSPNDVAVGDGDGLYGDAGSEAQTDGVPAADGPFTIGSGLPTAAGQSASAFIGPSLTADTKGSFVTSEQFSVSPDGQYFLIADARTDGLGGLYVWQISTGNEIANVAAYNFASSGLTGLTVDWSTFDGGNGTVNVYGVTTNANVGYNGNSVVSFQLSLNESEGTANLSNPTVLATAPAGESFRGVAMAPTAPAAAPPATTTTLSVTNNSGQYSQVTLTAHVTGASPTGYVSFQTSSGVEIGPAPVVNGVATLTPDSDLLAGSYTGLVAVYSGDANNAPSTSGAESATVAKYSTGSTLTDADHGTAVNGQPDLLTDTLSIPAGTDPTGTVTFMNGSSTLGTGTVTQEIVNGSPVFVATYSWTPTAAGTDSLSAVYAGDSNFATTTGDETVTVINPTTIVVTSNAQDPSGNGGTVTFTAAVTGSFGTPTGTVQFYINGIATGSPVTLNGSGIATFGPVTASLTETAPGTLTPGVDSVTAIYTPGSGSSYAGSTGCLNQTVQAKTIAAGDTLLYQVGDGSTTNFNGSAADNGNVVYIDEYTPSGSLVQQIVMPSVTANGYYALTQQTDNGTAGFINQTASGNGYVFGGVDYGLGAIPAGTTAPASIAFLSDSGTVAIDTVDTANQGYQLRSVASVNGSSFYEGTSGGVYYIAAGTDGAAVALTTALTARNVLIAPAPTGGEQLYISSGTAAYAGVSTVGTGLPTTTLQTVTLLSSTMLTEIGSSFGPYDYKFAELNPSDGYSVDTLYVLNDSTGATGGLQKWTYSATNGWTYTTVNAAGNTSTTEDTAVGISVSGGVATLSIQTDTQFAASPGGQVVTITDNSGYGGTGFANASVNYLESDSSNTGWHGDAYVSVGTMTVVTSNTADAADSGASVMFTATVTTTNDGGVIPTGSVQFYDGLIPLGSPVALNGSGVATLTVTTALMQESGLHITPGINSISAVYPGDFDGDYNAASGIESSTGAINQVVQAQAFGGGDQLTYRVGDGTTPLNSDGGTAAVFVDEYNSSGTLVQSIAMPTADGTGSDGNYYHALVQISSGASNPGQFAGQISQSGNGQYDFLAGYDDNPMTAVNAATDNALRSIARISTSGTVQIETINNATITTGSFTSNITGVYSPDGNQVWVDGIEEFGLMYVSSWQPGQATVAATQIWSNVSSTNYINELGLESFGGNLYMAVTTSGSSVNSYENIVNLGSLSSLTTAGAISLTATSP